MTAIARGNDKAPRYAALLLEMGAVADGEPDIIARMASAAAALAAAFPIFSWTGFYRVDAASGSSELVIGPYQGSLARSRIAFGKGVCGTAAARREIMIVPDVHAFEGHIACDARSRSEIVAPVFDATGALIGVLDIDSENLAAFDEIDAAGLRDILDRLFGSRRA